MDTKGEFVGRMGDEETQVREGFWPKMGRFAASVPFAEDAVAAWYCAFDRDTPNRVRFTLVGALAYFILPTDVIPDLLPIIGFADDASVLSAALLAVGSSINESHRTAASEALTRLRAGR